MLGKAIQIAATIHQNQKDNGGNAYILHPIRIMQRLRTSDEELMMIAILHDTIEDSNGIITIDILRQDGFSERVLNALTLLTHDKQEDYDSYIRKISTNRDAIRVKLEDLRDNSDITRLKGVRQKDFDRLIKYNKAYKFLTEVLKALDASGYQ